MTNRSREFRKSKEHRKDQETTTHYATIADTERKGAGCKQKVANLKHEIIRSPTSEHEKSRESISLLRATLDSTADGILVLSREGKVSALNPRFAEMWRIPESLLETGADAKLLEFVVDQLEDPGQFLEKVKRLYSETMKQSFDVLRFKDGRVFERYSRQQKLGEETVGRVWSFHDVTERTRLEELVKEKSKLLRESEQQYRSVVENIPVTVWTADQEGNTVFITPNAQRVCGYTPEQVYRDQYAYYWNRIHTDDLETIKSAYNALFRDGRPYDVEYRFQHPDGSWHWIHEVADKTYERNGVRYTDGASADITDWKRIEEELREARERLQYIVTSNPAVIYSGKPHADFSDFVLTYLSERVSTMLGFEPQEFIGHPEFWQCHVHPEGLRSVREQMPHLWKKGQHAFEYQFLHKDGGYRWIREEATVVRDADGKPIEVNGCWTDITELKRLERQLAESERLAAIGQTAAMVGHDLRNPLQGIAGAVHLLKQESLTGKERDEMLQLIQDKVEYSDAIIRDLFEYSTEIQLKLAETTPKSITRDATELVKVPEKVTVQDLSEEHPAIRVDLDRMSRVFVNLIQNAIDAMPQGGTLTISSKKSDGNVEITLTDTGSGILEKVMVNLWKPLQTTKAKGLGLGLAISKRFVEAHGGTISVKSKIGEGTTVTIRLPIKPEAAEVKQK